MCDFISQNKKIKKKIWFEIADIIITIIDINKHIRKI